MHILMLNFFFLEKPELHDKKYELFYRKTILDKSLGEKCIFSLRQVFLATK